MSNPAAMRLVGDEPAPVKTKHKSRTTQTGRSYRHIGNGYRYPEQSSRQALRLHRRAQGGLGLVLTGTGYEPKAKFDDYLPR